MRLARPTAAVAMLAAAIGNTGPATAQPAGAAVVNVYTTREKALIEPLLKVFEELARMKLNVVYVNDDPVKTLAPDVAAGKVDLFIASEFSQLVAAKAAGLTAAAPSAELATRVPAGLRDPDSHWYGLTRRIRIVATSKERVKQQAFSYEELAESKWKGKVCMRSGRHPYNVGLVASMIAHKGAAVTETWLKGLKANLAQKPAGGDRDQVGTRARRHVRYRAGQHLLRRLAAGQPGQQQQAAWGNAVRIVFPNAADRGAHVSISGMALAKGAANRANAMLLMDFMTSEPAQFIYGLDNHEYPINESAGTPGLVESWGKPKTDVLPLGDIAKLTGQALELIDRVGLDQGPGT